MTCCQIGSPAPDFRLPADDGSPVSLSGLRGKWVILYFYPKDDTPGCTTESCGFRDGLSGFESADAVVFGVSRDDLESHRKFREKYQLTFPLLSDEDGTVCTLYDVWREKNMYGKKSMGIERSTFLIAPDGTLAHIWRKVKVDGHVEAVLAVLEEKRASQQVA